MCDCETWYWHPCSLSLSHWTVLVFVYIPAKCFAAHFTFFLSKVSFNWRNSGQPSGALFFSCAPYRLGWTGQNPWGYRLLNVFDMWQGGVLYLDLKGVINDLKSIRCLSFAFLNHSFTKLRSIIHGCCRLDSIRSGLLLMLAILL